MHNLNYINMYTSNCYMNPVARAYIKTLELTSWSRSYSNMVLMSLYIKRRNQRMVATKVGR